MFILFVMHKKTKLLLLFLLLISVNSYSQNTNKIDSLGLKMNKRLPVLNGFRFIPSDVVKTRL